MADQIPLAALGFLIENLKEFILYNSEIIGGLDGRVENLVRNIDLMKGFISQYSRIDIDKNAILQTLTNDVRNVVYQAEDAIEKYIICRTLQQRRNFWSKAAHALGYAYDLRNIGKQVEDVSAKVSTFENGRASHGWKALRIEINAANKGEEKKKKGIYITSTAIHGIGGRRAWIWGWIVSFVGPVSPAVGSLFHGLCQNLSVAYLIQRFEQAPVVEDNVVGFESEAETAPVVEEKEKEVGFEDEAETVIKLLTGESQQLEIISIIGMPGLGKTTLANKVLNHPKAYYYNFSPRVFVNVSRDYDRREVFINILSDLKCQITPDMVDKEIVEKLRKELGTRKYLIVLDDVWTENAWDDLKVAFPSNNKGSRVLITSRHKHVASHANPSKDPHELRYMTGHESMKLLRRKVFGENACPVHLEDYESRILEKCDGLPLAIVDLARFLLNHGKGDYWWEKAAQSIGDYVVGDDSQLNEVIKMSLNHLPYHKKACFLYLGVFRKDFKIPVWKLLKLWIDEGFIQKDGDMTLEDIAEDYLEDLVDMSLVMVVRRRSNGKIQTCRIHDTLREFCIKEASKQNLFKEIKKFDQSTSLQSYRRICVNSNVKDYVTSKLSGDRVRSFLTFSEEEITVPVLHISSILKAFAHLRILDVKSLKFTQFPPELMNLVLLKYISMFCAFQIIPKKFSNLRNLQTIIIHTTFRTLEIRADISKLDLLRHLLTNASASLGKSREPSAANTNLQTLCVVSPESCTKELFERYTKLKKLGIRGNLANGDALFHTLVKLEFLENLKLINNEECPLKHLPSGTEFPKNLRRLTLMNTSLDWSQISTLGKLQKLEVLKLKANAFDGELWDTEDGGFRCLKVLHIGNTQRFISWNANASHFPMLTSLYLKHCANLEAIPHGFAHIPTLQSIDLHCCTKPSVADSAREIQQLKLHQAQQMHNKTVQFKLVVYTQDQ